MEGPARPVVAILDYGIGNLRSAQKAMERAGADAQLTADPGVVAAAAGVMLPGVGAMARCMDALTGSGLRQVVVDATMSGRPFLGVCVGMQMLHAGSEEHGGVEGLGVFDAVVRRISGEVKIPQMQWNVVDQLRPSWLLDELVAPTWMYFVHSYAPEIHADVVATCDYGGPIGAVVQRAMVAGTQFHPEKSASTGLALLANFVRECRISAVAP